MIEGVGRKIAAIVIVLLGAIAALFPAILEGRPIVNLGLDLRGGSRLVYRLDIQRAIRDGQIGSNESESDVVEQVISIMADRIDALQLREIPISRQGTDGISIELPGLDKESVENIKRVIQNLGNLEFRIVADPQDGVDLDAEEKKLDGWLETRPEVAGPPVDGPGLHTFNTLAENEGGPRKGIRWVPLWEDDRLGKKSPSIAVGTLVFDRAVPLWAEEERGENPDWVFRGDDLAGTRPDQDSMGNPAVYFELKPAKSGDFERFTTKYKGRQMAIVLNGAVRTAPGIQEVLPGRGQINGGMQGFDLDEMKELLTVLRTGSLRLRPELDFESSVGPSLGEDAIRLGEISALVGAVLVFTMMASYYRLSGWIANLGIFLNLGILFATLAFFRATLTLPGIAGMALTVGMAVDANILIYERIREEREKGRTLAQAVTNGFDRALATIVDSNLTTLLTGIILFKVGTGPIRGFAVTLCIGILTTLFVSLVVTRVIYHFLLAGKRIQNLRMARLFSKPNLQFTRYRHAAAAASILVIVAGLLVFAQRGEAIYGVDFTGGAVVRVQTKEPVAIGEIRSRITGQIGSAQVVAMRGEGGTPAGTSTQFVIKIKLSSAERETYEANPEQRPYVEQVRQALEGLLVPPAVDPPRIETGAATGGGSLVGTTIHLEEPITASDLERALAGATALREPTVAPAGPGGRDWAVSAKAAPGVEPEGIHASIVKALENGVTAQGEKFVPSDPIPESNILWPRVVRELRDKAVLAMLLSWLGIVIYLRLRFREYRYGVAAVVALVHDVLVTVGAVAVASAVGLVDVEIDLGMIAAFLTITGFSVNDTIVVYDRIRENLPRHTDHLGRLRTSLATIVDESVNQTLSRTILTSGTVLLVTLAIFVVNRGAGTVLEGWAFAMSIGVLTGTYSTVYIAAPLLITIENFVRRRGQATPAPSVARQPAPAAAEP